eukprot:scaffold2103_cov185-Amphora_coffeaeformis.AAC.34
MVGDGPFNAPGVDVAHFGVVFGRWDCVKIDARRGIAGRLVSKRDEHALTPPIVMGDLDVASAKVELLFQTIEIGVTQN